MDYFCILFVSSFVITSRNVQHLFVVGFGLSEFITTCLCFHVVVIQIVEVKFLEHVHFSDTHPPPWLFQLLKDLIGIDAIIKHLLIVHFATLFLS
jgi:hypothetical protein